MKHVDPFVARFMQRVEERNKEVQDIIKSGIDIADEDEYNDPSPNQE